MGAPQFWQHMQAIEHIERLWDHRFADVISGKRFSLKERDRIALLRNQRRNSRSRRPASNDNDLRMIRRGG